MHSLDDDLYHTLHTLKEPPFPRPAVLVEYTANSRLTFTFGFSGKR